MANLSLNFYKFEQYLIDIEHDCILGYTGIHYIFKFPNGYGASVVKSFGSQGYIDDLWELCTILYTDEHKFEFTPSRYELIYPYEISGPFSGPTGNLTEVDILRLLDKIYKFA